MSALSDWQDAFTDALRGLPPQEVAVRAAAAHPAFAIYRNTVWKGWVDAIEANYPAVAALTGRDWLRAAAREFAARTPPATPVLAAYGEGLADFLAGFPPAAGLPYLADVARLDRAWTEAHMAADADAATPADLAALPPDALATLSARPHPSLRAFWFERTIPSLWLANRPDCAGGALRLDPRPQGLAIVRPREAVEAVEIDAASFAFLRACQAGRSILHAAAAARSADPAADLGATLTRIAGLGALAGFRDAQTGDDS
jgi:Putative DNA-binding domain